ncbi:response regulator [candidate division CSSED10-310 bacterium]|uniref:histidine kinase n=1 Tax=candidate division CSSED10-310 bacterium TaxID=2855610 RepID=A0ABV6YTV8_UNCC1
MKRKILIIEDEEAVRFNIVEILEMENFITFGAANGRDGVRLARKHLPDLVICDILMPELNGYEVLAELRNTRKTAHIPFIFLTAKATPRDFRRGMGLGADDYITKPFKIDDLLSTIQTQFEKREAASKELREVLTTLSFTLPHEMMTPLTSILGFSQLLTQSTYAASSDEVTLIGRAIYKNGIRLKRLIGNYLLYTDLKHGKNEHLEENWLWEESVLSKDAIQDFVEHLVINYDRTDDLVLELTAARLRIAGNAFLKILEELIDNAFKFSEPGTPVKVFTESQKNHYLLIIADQGCGMKKDQVEIIGPFTQFDRDYYEQQGSGLGLYISKSLIESCRGDLNIKTEYGRGTTVTVVLEQ